MVERQERQGGKWKSDRNAERFLFQLNSIDPSETKWGESEQVKSHFECELFRCPITNNKEIVQKGQISQRDTCSFIEQIFGWYFNVGILPIQVLSRFKCLSCSVDHCEIAYQTSTNRAKISVYFLHTGRFLFLFSFFFELSLKSVRFVEGIMLSAMVPLEFIEWTMSLAILIALRFRSNLSFNIN